MKRNLITITYESNIYHKPLERGLYLPTNFKKENVWQLEGSTTKEICEQFCDFNWINEEQPIMKIKIVEWVTDEERQAYKKEALDALEQMKIKNNEQLEYACKE